MRIGATTRRFRDGLARLLRVAPGADERAAAAALGNDHALARLLARRRALTCQILVTSIPLACASVGVMLDAGKAPLVLAATSVVEIGLLVAVPYFRARTRDVTQELIASGEDAALALRPVQEEGRRLASRRERERFAQSLERSSTTRSAGTGSSPRTGRRTAPGSCASRLPRSGRSLRSCVPNPRTSAASR